MEVSQQVEEPSQDIDSLADQLSRIDYSERVVLLPQCLRSSRCTAPRADYGRVECQSCYVHRDSEMQNCYIPTLIAMARQIGYKEVHVFTGGRAILPFFMSQGMFPKAVLAVACEDEVKEGLEKLARLKEESGISLPAQVVPLLSSRDERFCSESLLFRDPENLEYEWRRMLTQYPPKNGK